jgi:DNA invertase Pin-like site-specific DNA recombinase
VIPVVKAAIYTRVSTEDQAKEGYSLDAQKERLEAYCEAQGWEISEFYIDEGHSGRNTKRPEYQRMLEERDNWDILLVLKMDRIHRNSKNFMIMMEDLEKWGKKFASMQESLDTSNAVGRFVVDIIQRIAQLESEQIGERTYMGMRQKADAGEGILGFHSPFGYLLEGEDLVQDEGEADIIRRIFDSYLQGTSMEDIAWYLNREDIPTRRGNQWTIWSISRILHNTVYAGFLTWDGVVYRGDHIPIISIEDYNSVQSLIASRTKNPAHRRCIELPASRLDKMETDEGSSVPG